RLVLQCAHDHRHLTSFPTRRSSDLIENLHRLCWKHHRLKTLGLLDPVREPDGSTTWILYGRAVRRERQNTDLLTPALAEALQRRSEEHTSELQSRFDLVCRLLLEKK